MRQFNDPPRERQRQRLHRLVKAILGGLLLALLILAVLPAASVRAQTPTPAGIPASPQVRPRAPTQAVSPTQNEAQYQRERVACDERSVNQDRASCLREAAAARDARARGALDGGDRGPVPADKTGNAAARCEPLAGDERRDCLDRASGGGQTRGGVEQGGIYRESVSRELPAPPAVAPVQVKPSAGDQPSAPPQPPATGSPPAVPAAPSPTGTSPGPSPSTAPLPIDIRPLPAEIVPKEILPPPASTPAPASTR